jgi:hypothetical protein
MIHAATICSPPGGVTARLTRGCHERAKVARLHLRLLAAAAAAAVLPPPPPLLLLLCCRRRSCCCCRCCLCHGALMQQLQLSKGALPQMATPAQLCCCCCWCRRAPLQQLQQATGSAELSRLLLLPQCCCCHRCGRNDNQVTLTSDQRVP